MAKLSKYYKVTNQMMIEYISDQYDQNPANRELVTSNVDYRIYEGLDGNIYYTEPAVLTQDGQPTNKYDYTDGQIFIKFGDKSDSEYVFYGLLKDEDTGIYSNNDLIQEKLDDPDHKTVSSCTEVRNDNIYYDKIRVHLIYGFQLDTLAGFTLQVKTMCKAVKPLQKSSNNRRFEFDENGNPVFNTVTDINNNVLEQLVNDKIEVTLLDMYFPKECLILKNVLKWHKTPIYQNGSFYDRYIEIKVPSAYYMQLHNVNLSSNSVYGSVFNKAESGYIASVSGSTVDYKIGSNVYHFPRFSDEKLNEYYDKGTTDPEFYGKLLNLLPDYAIPAEDYSQRQVFITVLPDPEVIINFATVKDENSVKDTVNIDGYQFRQTFVQDPINQISTKYCSNSDLFNAKILFDKDNAEIIYYPVFGIGNSAVELSWDVMQQIETGAIPMITEAFMDQMANTEEFYEEYGPNAYKWIIYNDLMVTYNYTNLIIPTNSEEEEIPAYVQHFTNIIDYGIQNPDIAGAFWKSTFIPKVNSRPNLVCKNICIQYTCRLMNRLNNVEAIRTATLLIDGDDVDKFRSKRISIGNITTYKVVNRIKRNEIYPKNTVVQTGDKLIRSYYDATNLVVKDMGNNNLYTQGQMTLYLKHTSHNYMFRLFSLNEDNIRIPYDLTGPYRYKLVFPTLSGQKIQIFPNTDNKDLNLGIGQLIFYITEEQVKQIMKVSAGLRYFAIMTDTDNKDQLESTLYEGKVMYYS